MAYSLIAHTAKQQTTDAIDTTGADLLVACVCGFDSSDVVSDNKSNTWIPLTAQTIGGLIYSNLYYVRGGTVGSGHTFSAPHGYASVAIAAFSGSVASPFDQENGATGSSITSLASGSITPAADNELIISAIGLGETSGITQDGSFIFLDSVDGVSGIVYGIGLSYKIQTTAGAVNPTWTWTSSVNGAVANIASFKAAASSSVVGSNFYRQVAGMGGGF